MVEFCWKTWILLEFLSTHVPFLWGREVRGSKYPQAPTKPEGFGTRAGLQSLNKCAKAALQPQICGVSQPRG